MDPPGNREVPGRVHGEGPHALRDVEHLCGGLVGPGGTYGSEYLRLRYEATRTPGIGVPRGRQCRMAWVQAVGG